MTESSNTSATAQNDLSIGYRAGQQDSVAWRLLRDVVDGVDSCSLYSGVYRPLDAAMRAAREALRGHDGQVPLASHITPPC